MFVLFRMNARFLFPKEVVCMDSEYYYYYFNECNLINYTNTNGGIYEKRRTNKYNYKKSSTNI